MTEGSCLRLELTGDTLKLTPVATAVVVEKIGKRRVIVGWEGFDAATAVNEARAEQVARLEASFLCLAEPTRPR